MAERLQSNRIPWIDMAKGYGMLFVIYAHIGVGPLWTWIYSFHMPLFFGSMSIVGVRFFESRSFFAFEGILMFGRKILVLLHSKQTFKCQSMNELISF